MPKYFNCSTLSKDCLSIHVVSLSCILFTRYKHKLRFLSKLSIHWIFILKYTRVSGTREKGIDSEKVTPLRKLQDPCYKGQRTAQSPRSRLLRANLKLAISVRRQPSCDHRWFTSFRGHRNWSLWWFQFTIILFGSFQRWKETDEDTPTNRVNYKATMSCQTANSHSDIQNIPFLVRHPKNQFHED